MPRHFTTTERGFLVTFFLTGVTYFNMILRPVLLTVPWCGKNAFTSHQCEDGTKVFPHWIFTNLNKNWGGRKKNARTAGSLTICYTPTRGWRPIHYLLPGGTSVPSQADGFPGHGWQWFTLWALLSGRGETNAMMAIQGRAQLVINSQSEHFENWDFLCQTFPCCSWIVFCPIKNERASK